MGEAKAPAAMARILVVDDERALLDELRETLARAGHEVRCATNGAEALESIRAQAPDLVLSDIDMPKLGGYQLLSTLRSAHPELGEIPFLFLSKMAQPGHLIEGLELGADDYIPKPFEARELLARVACRLRERDRLIALKEQQLVKLYKALSNEGGAREPANEAANGSPTTAQLSQLIPGASGDLTVGRFKVIDLDAVPEKLRQVWESDSDRVNAVVEETIRHHLGPQDFVIRDHQGNFVVHFAELSEEQAAPEAQDLAELICTRLLGERSHPDPSQVSAEVHSIRLERNTIDGLDSLLEELCRRLDQRADRFRRMSEDLVKEIAESRSLALAPVMATSGKQLPLMLAGLDDKFSSRIAQLSLAKGEGSRVIARIELDMLDRVVRYVSAHLESDPGVVVVPVRYSTLRDSATSGRYLELCRSIPTTVAKHLSFIIENCPRNVFPCERNIKALSAHSRHRIVELREPTLSQIDCKYLEVATVGIRYDALMSNVCKNPHRVQSFVSSAHDQMLPVLVTRAPADSRQSLNQMGIDLMSGSWMGPDAVRLDTDFVVA